MSPIKNPFMDGSQVNPAISLNKARIRRARKLESIRSVNGKKSSSRLRTV